MRFDKFINRITKLKFRVWHTKLNRYLYGYEEAEKYFLGLSNDMKHKNDLAIEFAIEPDDYLIIQRAIGLKDKNGREIFEGDILGELYDGEWCTRGLVNWNEDEAKFYMYFPEEGTLGDFGDLDNDTKDLLIIGNLFENEDLLKPVEDEDE